MRRINNTYDWLKWMHKKNRFSPNPTVLAVRGGELVRGRPSEVRTPPPGRGPKPIEEQEKSANAEAPTATGL